MMWVFRVTELLKLPLNCEPVQDPLHPGSLCLRSGQLPEELQLRLCGSVKKNNLSPFASGQKPDRKPHVVWGNILDGEGRGGIIYSCILPIACWLEGSKSGTKTFVCLSEVLQLLFSRDAFPPTVIYSLDGTMLLSAVDGPLCKNQMHDLWSQNDPNPVAHLMGLWENGAGFWDLFPVLACVFNVMTFWGEKRMLFVKQVLLLIAKWLVIS